MEALLSLVGIVLLLGLVVFPIWAITRIVSLGGQNDALASRLGELESDLRELRAKLTLLANRPPRLRRPLR
jgi:hypothetical protein